MKIVSFLPRIALHLHNSVVYLLFCLSVCLEPCPACLPVFSRPRYEGWPHHEQSFPIDVCLPPSLLLLSVTTQCTILCCLSMSSWVYLEYGSLVLYLLLIPSAGSLLFFSIYAHSMPVSFLSQMQVDFLWKRPFMNFFHPISSITFYNTVVKFQSLY